MNNAIFDKTYYVEIPIGASNTAQQYLFPTLQNLDGKLTQGIETFPPTIVTKTPAGATPANLALLLCSYINLVMGDTQQIWNMPLVKFISTVFPGSTTVPKTDYAVEFNNLKIIWAKSYVFVADTTKIAASAESFVFNISYMDDPGAGK